MFGSSLGRGRSSTARCSANFENRAGLAEFDDLRSHMVTAAGVLLQRDRYIFVNHAGVDRSSDQAEANSLWNAQVVDFVEYSGKKKLIKVRWLYSKEDALTELDDCAGANLKKIMAPMELLITDKIDVIDESAVEHNCSIRNYNESDLETEWMTHSQWFYRLRLHFVFTCQQWIHKSCAQKIRKQFHACDDADVVAHILRLPISRGYHILAGDDDDDKSMVIDVDAVGDTEEVENRHWLVVGTYRLHAYCQYLQARGETQLPEDWQDVVPEGWARSVGSGWPRDRLEDRREFAATLKKDVIEKQSHGGRTACTIVIFRFFMYQIIQFPTEVSKLVTPGGFLFYIIGAIEKIGRAVSFIRSTLHADSEIGRKFKGMISSVQFKSHYR
ncbi:hypothetical protein B0H10DRAFT_2198164 [Mycena sp. CBHHK59/15]|nr:hypothetical protein B0H10DRAFT_2198164 [Mycena sp. CBHHK59/15]